MKTRLILEQRMEAILASISKDDRQFRYAGQSFQRGFPCLDKTASFRDATFLINKEPTFFSSISRLNPYF
jgi:hypothetical protein